MKRVLSTFLTAFLSFALLASPPGLAGALRTGQWIWTQNDLSLYKDRRHRDPGLEAGVFIATIVRDHDRTALKRALSPGLVAPLRAVVIRFDDSFHAAWKQSDAEVANETGRLLATLLQQVDDTGAEPTEIQLDYDCPERLLPRWSRLLRSLSNGALKNREVWITTLTSQLRQDDFGKLFQGSVEGHIPQVFDTGEAFSPEAAATLRERLDRAALPFRLGLGAFERASENGTNATDHGRWREAIPMLKTSVWFRGLWIFPAGQPWSPASQKGPL